MAHGARGQFRVWARTRGSPRSLRLRSFSCRLLRISFPASASPSADAEEPPERPRKYGEMTPLQSLKTAYSGICERTRHTTMTSAHVVSKRSCCTPKDGGRETHDEIQPPHPRPKRAAADLARPGDVHDVKAPLEDAWAREVLPSGDERAGRRVASRGADTFKVSREEDGGDERERVHPERERCRAERGAVEEEAEEQRERARGEQAQSEILDRVSVLLRCEGARGGQ